MQSKELAVQGMSIPDIALAFYQSGLFPDIKSAAQAIVKIQAGRELGFGPIYSMQKIYIVQGKIVMAAEAMGAKIKQSGRYDYHVTEYTDNKLTLVFTENGKDVFTSSFTIEDARKAGLLKDGSGWLKFPRAMLMSKALSQGARIVCPHLIAGAYTPEDFGIETDDEGYITQPQRVNVVTGEVVETSSNAVSQAPVTQGAVTEPKQAVTDTPDKLHEAMKENTPIVAPVPEVKTQAKNTPGTGEDLTSLIADITKVRWEKSSIGYLRNVLKAVIPASDNFEQAWARLTPEQKTAFKNKIADLLKSA